MPPPRLRCAGRAGSTWVIVLAVIATLVAAAGALLNASSATPAPDVTFQSIDGARPRLSDLRGQVVLVTFWSTTCTPCLRKMPALMDMHRRLAPDGFVTWAVAMSYDRPDRVLNYVERQQPPFGVSLDVGGVIAASFEDTRATPTLFLVDRQGRIVRRWVGEPDVAAVERRVREALAQPVG